jgi:O-antigen ligase
LIVLAASPAIHALATWDIDGNISAINQTLRLYSLPIIWLEIMVLLLAARDGWRPLVQFRGLPKIVQGLLAAFLVLGASSSVLIAEDVAVSLLHFSKYWLQIMLLGAITFHLAKARDFSISRWIEGINWGSAAYLLIIVLFCLLIVDPQTFRWVERLPSATNVRQIGNLIGLAAIVPAATLLLNPKAHLTLAAFVFTTACLAFVMWSGTRGALVGYFGAIIVAGWLCREWLFPRRLLMIASSCILAALLSLTVPAPAPEFGLIRVHASFYGEDSSSGRIKMWANAANAIKDAPFIGHGAGTYRANMAESNGYPYNHPHNFVLQYAYDWGLAGGSLALLLLGNLGLAILRKTESKPQEKFIATGGYAGLLTIGLIEGTLFHPLPMLFAIALIAPLLRERTAKPVGRLPLAATPE